MGAPSSFGAVSLEGRGTPPRSGGAHLVFGKGNECGRAPGTLGGAGFELKESGLLFFPCPIATSPFWKSQRKRQSERPGKRKQDDSAGGGHRAGAVKGAELGEATQRRRPLIGRGMFLLPR